MRSYFRGHEEETPCSVLAPGSPAYVEGRKEGVFLPSWGTCAPNSAEHNKGPLMCVWATPGPWQEALVSQGVGRPPGGQCLC